MGTGSPFLSKEVKKLLDSIRRREVRTNVAKAMTSPIHAQEYVQFTATVSKMASKVLGNFVTECNHQEENQEAEAVNPVDFLQDVVSALALPFVFDLLAQISRGSVHRGEAYALQHSELHPENVCFRALHEQLRYQKLTSRLDRIELELIASISNLSDRHRRLETDRFEFDLIGLSSNLSVRTRIRNRSIRTQTYKIELKSIGSKQAPRNR